MDDLFLLSEAQMRRVKPHFPLSSLSTFLSLTSSRCLQTPRVISTSALSCPMREPAVLDDFSTRAARNSCSCCG